MNNINVPHFPVLQGLHDEIHPANLHTVFPAKLFQHLWLSSRAQGHTPGFVYTVFKVISTGDGADDGFGISETIGNFNSGYEANEHALVRFHEIGVHLERQMFPPTKEWKIFDGCLYLRGRYLLPDYTPSNYVISVLRHRENVPVFCRQELGAFYPFI